MIKNITLSLLMGPVVPIPVPRAVTEALTSATIRTGTGDQDGFQLTFTFSSRSVLNTLLPTIGQVGPFIRVVLIATLGATPTVLMDGVITHQQVTPNVENGQSTLTLDGKDVSAVMNLQEFTGLPYPAMPIEARVALIVLKYAVFGMIPLVIPSLFPDVPIPTDRIPIHEGTDLAYIQRMAQEAGYVFYVDPGPAPGMSVAYWGPEIKVGVAQPALNVNMDAYTNIESLNFRYDAEKKTIPVVYVQNQQTRVPIPIPIPDITPLNPPLGAIPPFNSKIAFLDYTARLSPMRAILAGLAVASQSSDAVFGDGKLDVMRYGRILKARQLVGVRGAGLAYDGLYYVKSVTHHIKRGEYKQDFSLSRNGLVSITPVVPA
ncbi:MAG TPA: hypothetical protein VMT34_06130 [Aggregatilineales bacterium]|nr:hypothetical protein [Aggregatilineales bacterium]